jgi:hypothetical protein
MPPADAFLKRNVPFYRILLALLFAVLMCRVCGTSQRVISGESIRYLVADDSMITLRVAYNFAHHLGPYFNAGEHVAANTSLFWPLFLYPIFALFHDPARAVQMVSLLSVLLSALTVACAVYFAGSYFSGIAVGICLLLTPSFYEYGATGWEHVPQMLFVTLGLLTILGAVDRLEKDRLEWGLIFLSVACLVRPDSLLMLAPVGLFVLRSALRRNKKIAWISLVFAAFSVAAYFGLMFHFYHSFVPNTYYLKVNGGLGLVRLGIAYLVRASRDSGIPMFFAGLLVLWSLTRRTWSSEENLVLFTCALQIAYVVVIGGDIFLYARFFLCLAPALVFLFWRKIEAFLPAPEISQRLAFYFAVLLPLAGLFIAQAYSAMYRSQDNIVLTKQGIVADVEGPATWMALVDVIRARVAPADGEIGMFYLGSVSYYLPEYRIADFLGKADAVIAHEPVKWGVIGHNKWDFVHTLRDRNVSVVPYIPGPLETVRKIADSHAGPASGGVAFQLDPYLRDHYTFLTPAQLDAPGDAGLYVRNDLVAKVLQGKR